MSGGSCRSLSSRTRPHRSVLKYRLDPNVHHCHPIGSAAQPLSKVVKVFYSLDGDTHTAHSLPDRGEVDIGQIHGGWIGSLDRILMDFGPVCCVIEHDHSTAVGLIDEGSQVGQCHLAATIA